MARLESRIHVLEAQLGVSTTVDGRDPGLIELYRFAAEREGVDFDIEEVPRWVTVRDLLAVIGAGRRCLPSEWDAEADAATARWDTLIAQRAREHEIT